MTNNKTVHDDKVSKLREAGIKTFYSLDDRSELVTLKALQTNSENNRPQGKLRGFWKKLFNIFKHKG